jgi:RNA polymerase sigma-70 factor (ECF subfamily)
MMSVMGVRQPTIDHGARLLEIYDDAAWDAVIDQHLVGDAMAELGPHHRSALSSRYFDGLPAPEVAAHLGRTVEATERLLVRARRRFRTVYEQQGGAS